MPRWRERPRFSSTWREPGKRNPAPAIFAPGPVLPTSTHTGQECGGYAPTFSLSHFVVWDFGRVMGSHQARLMMSWERRPMARETLKNTV